MKIPLKNKKGEVIAHALIDEKDYAEVSKIKWSMTPGKYNYATGNIKEGGRWKTNVKMHRLILKPEQHELVDHINGDGLNNRRENLRICDRSQNAMNSTLPVNSTSGYKGVTRLPRLKKNGLQWMAQINCRGKHKTVGYFRTPKEAAQAYDKAAMELHGEFARLNLAV